jgi:hypothetical protein
MKYLKIMPLIEKEQKTFATIISDGTLRVQSTEDDPHARKREWELKDGTKGVKYERIYKGLTGKIINVEFYDGDYGKSLNITFEKDSPNEDDIIVAIGTATNFAEDLMKKLPSINFAEPVTFSPYSFVGDDGKTKKGVTVWQGEEGGKEKIQNFFYDPDKKKNTNKFPNPEGNVKEYDSDDWKIYFTKTRKFLVKYIEDNIIPKFESKKLEELGDEIKAEDIPM